MPLGLLPLPLLLGEALLLREARGLRRRPLLLLAAPPLRERDPCGLRLSRRSLLGEHGEPQSLTNRPLQRLPGSLRLAHRITFPLEGFAERSGPLCQEVRPHAAMDAGLGLDLLLGGRLVGPEQLGGGLLPCGAAGLVPRVCESVAL